MPYALVLGASGDIGEACVMRLAAEGWSIYCHFNKNQKKSSDLVKKLTEKYPKQDFFMIQLDMSEKKVSATFFEQLFQVDAVIFASGDTVYKLLTDTTVDEMDALWNCMVKSPIQICQNLQSKLAKTKKGRIIFIGSVYGLVGSAMEVVYSTVKGAQQSFVKAYAQEVASLGITVNLVAPGAVATKMNEAWTTEELEDLRIEIPVGRLAEPEEVAGAVNYLASDSASYLTGIVLPVTGGWKM
ncbi:SDR family oxidoreductase [Vagococcus sp. PNs007]|uniref:SDR family oxidoreductase n=1 Tax=Vagococcus proximus TaxID=2991417 RepID=A0ABT5X166_9ENTE|nr:SDR family oxidoreductase [Vagococcus proximus]MDF0479740.1 SDR family oxidoreductase [Vagococcus proximus]